MVCGCHSVLCSVPCVSTIHCATIAHISSLKKRLIREHLFQTHDRSPGLVQHRHQTGGQDLTHVTPKPGCLQPPPSPSTLHAGCCFPSCCSFTQVFLKAFTCACVVSAAPGLLSGHVARLPSVPWEGRAVVTCQDNGSTWDGNPFWVALWSQHSWHLPHSFPRVPTEAPARRA